MIIKQILLIVLLVLIHQNQYLVLTQEVVVKSKYNKTILNYNPSLKINDIWDEINEKKLKRDYRVDMEEYRIEDLAKTSYKINIYLSKK